MTDKQAGGMTFSYPHEHFHEDDTEDDLKADWTPEVDPIHTPTTKEPSYWDDPKPDHFASLSYQALDDALGRLVHGFESPTEYTEEDAPYEGKHPILHKLVKSIEDAGDTQPGDPDYSKVDFPADHESAPKNASGPNGKAIDHPDQMSHAFDPTGNDVYCPFADKEARTNAGFCQYCGATDHKPMTKNAARFTKCLCPNCKLGLEANDSHDGYCHVGRCDASGNCRHASPDPKESSMTYKEAHDMVNDLASGHMPSHPSKQDQEDEAGILDLFSDMADDAGTYVEQPSKKYRREHHMGVDMRALDHDYADISHSVDEHLFDNPQPIPGGYKEPLPDDQKNKIKAHPLPQIPKDHKTIKPWSADKQAGLGGWLDDELDNVYDSGYSEGLSYAEDQLADGSLSHEEIITDGEEEEGPQASHGYVDDGDEKAYEQFIKGFIKAMYDEIEGRAKIDASLANPDRTVLAAASLSAFDNGYADCANGLIKRPHHPFDDRAWWADYEAGYSAAEQSFQAETHDRDQFENNHIGTHSDYNEEHIDRHLLDDKSDSWYDDDDDKPWPHTAPGPPKRPKTGTHEDYNEEHIDRHLLDDKSDSWYDDDDGKPWPNTAPGPPKRPHHADRQEFLRGYHDGLAKGESGAEPNGASAFPAEKNVGWPQGDAPPKSGNPSDWGYDEGFAGGMADGANGLFLPRRKNAPPPSKQSSRHLAGESVEMASIPDCDVCKMNGKTTPAVYDARLPGAGGSWGYVCQRHFDQLGPGQLGTGHGQRLIKRESSRHLGGSDWADELLQTDPPCVVCGDRANNMVKDDYEKQFVPVCDEHRGSDGYVKRYDGDEHHQGSRRSKIAATVDDFLEWKAKQGDPITLTTGVPSDRELAAEIAEWAKDVDLTPQEVEDYVYSKQAAFRRRAAEIDSDDYRYGYMDGKDWGSDQESGWTNANAIEALTDIFGGPNQTPREGDYEKGFLDGAHAAKPRPSQSQIDHGASLKVAVGARPYIDKKTRQTGWHCKECSIGKRTAQYGEAKALADNHNNWYHHELRKRHASVERNNPPKEGKSTMASRNEAGQQRRTLVAAVATQQKMINALAAQNELLRRGIVTIASAAGITRHPRLAGLVTLADNGDPVATSTDEARKPDATDNVDSYGAAPAGANVGVDPEANTDVTQYTTTLPEDAINDLIDVTAPVPGTDAPWPPAVGEQVPTLLTNPDITPMDNMSGWKSSRRHQGTGVYTVGDNDGDGGEPDSRPEDDETSPGGKHTRDPNGISPEDMKTSMWHEAGDGPPKMDDRPDGPPTSKANQAYDEKQSQDANWAASDVVMTKDGPYPKDEADAHGGAIKRSSRDPQVRLFAAMKLAKTRIALGMGSGDELADAQRICDDPQMSTQAIRSLTSELDRVTASVQSERRTASRSRVPQRADGVERTMPSVQAQSSRPHVESGPGTPTSEEFGDLG